MGLLKPGPVLLRTGFKGLNLLGTILGFLLLNLPHLVQLSDPIRTRVVAIVSLLCLSSNSSQTTRQGFTQLEMQLSSLVLHFLQHYLILHNYVP